MQIAAANIFKHSTFPMFSSSIHLTYDYEKYIIDGRSPVILQCRTLAEQPSTLNCITYYMSYSLRSVKK